MGLLSKENCRELLACEPWLMKLWFCAADASAGDTREVSMRLITPSKERCHSRC